MIDVIFVQEVDEVIKVLRLSAGRGLEIHFLDQVAQPRLVRDLIGHDVGQLVVFRQLPHTGILRNDQAGSSGDGGHDVAVESSAEGEIRFSQQVEPGYHIQRKNDPVVHVDGMGHFIRIILAGFAEGRMSHIGQLQLFQPLGDEIKIR